MDSPSVYTLFLYCVLLFLLHAPIWEWDRDDFSSEIYLQNEYLPINNRPLSRLFSPQRSFDQCIWTMFICFDVSLSRYPLFWYQINIRLNSIFCVQFLKKTSLLYFYCDTSIYTKVHTVSFTVIQYGKKLSI